MSNAVVGCAGVEGAGLLALEALDAEMVIVYSMHYHPVVIGQAWTGQNNYAAEAVEDTMIRREMSATWW